MSAQDATELGSNPEEQELKLLEQARAGDSSVHGPLLERHRDRLIRMVRMRMDPRLAQRVDPADVVQEATIEAARRLPEFLATATVDFYVWMRWITRDRLVDLQRAHVHTLKRQAGRDVPLNMPLGDASSQAFVGVLAGHLTSPSRAAHRAEIHRAIHEALEDLEETDREILVLRHFEQLSIEQTAQSLNMSKSGASKRHVRAMRELRRRLQPFLDAQ